MRENPDYFTQSSPEQMTEEDQEVMARINEALAADSRTAETTVLVEVFDGEAILRGETTEPGVRAAVEEVTRGVPGVRSVVNKIISHGAGAGQ